MTGRRMTTLAAGAMFLCGGSGWAMAQAPGVDAVPLSVQGSGQTAAPGAEVTAVPGVSPRPAAQPGGGMVAGVPLTVIPPALAHPAALPAGGGNLGAGASGNAGAPAAPPGGDALDAGGKPTMTAASSVPTPRVPPEVKDAAAAVPKPNAVQQSLIQTGVGSVMVRPGVANIFPVAAGRVNRIVTPFVRARVSSEAAEGIEVHGGVIYVTPATESPISMFITEDGDESVAVSVTLVPAHTPPVHLELQLPADVIATKAVRRVPQDAATAERFERAQPFVDMIRSLMRGLALGRVPAGFEMLARPPAGRLLPVCVGAPLRVDFSRAQYLRGSHVEVWVGVVSNPGSEATEFLESACGGPEVLSVALSPTPLVPAGGASEIYVARRYSADEESRSSRRPTLLSGRP